MKYFWVILLSIILVSLLSWYAVKDPLKPRTSMMLNACRYDNDNSVFLYYLYDRNIVIIASYDKLKAPLTTEGHITLGLYTEFIAEQDTLKCCLEDPIENKMISEYFIAKDNNAYFLKDNSLFLVEKNIDAKTIFFQEEETLRERLEL